MLRAVAGMICILFVGTAAADDRLNVVVLLADDLRWDSIGCAGNPTVVTPHINRLAREGVRFTQARVTTSICMTSRATLLTGQHMARHQIQSFGSPLTSEAFAASYPAVLRSAGYHTGYVGKYGVGSPPEGGFDFVRAYEGRHWMADGKGGKVHVTEKNARDAIDFLAARPREKPFCLCVGFFAPHAEDRAVEQYLPQPFSVRFYLGVEIAIPRTASEEHLKKMPPFITSEKNEGRVRFHKRFDTPEKYQRTMTNYYRLVSEVDDAIGRIVVSLKKHGVYDNTLILFTGDNGYFHGEHGLADKWYPYEEALRVPLVIRDPRLPAAKRGAVVNALALNLDVAPTIVRAAQAEVPTVVQGQDLSPLYLADRLPRWRDAYYYEHPVVLGMDRIPRSEAVVNRAAKLIRWPDFNTEELFDLKADPYEEHNLAADPKAAALRDSLREKLTKLKAEAR